MDDNIIVCIPEQIGVTIYLSIEALFISFVFTDEEFQQICISLDNCLDRYIIHDS